MQLSVVLHVCLLCCMQLLCNCAACNCCAACTCLLCCMYDTAIAAISKQRSDA